MFWQKEIETIDRKKLEKFQLECINKQILVSKKSKYYKEKLQNITKINSLKEIEKLPFTTKQDLRDFFPYGFLCEKKDSIVRIQSSSGTTGNPTIVFHTKQDVNNWANLIARGMYMVGVRHTDVFQITDAYGLFTGGLGFHYAGDKLGTMIIPIGPGNSERQILFMKNFQTTVVSILPSYALRLYKTIEEMGIDIHKDLNLKIFSLGAEPHSEETRKKIEKLYGVKAYNSYGLSEVSGPGIAYECPYQEGPHVWEDYVYPEIIDPKTLEVLPDGKEGELVLTTLQRQAMPLIRYRTRDLTRIISEPCKCGRTHRRIARITARTDDMLIINGVNIFPIQIEKVIMSIPEIANNYLIEVFEENYMKKLKIKIEINKNKISSLESISKKLLQNLKNELLVTPIIEFVEENTIPTRDGKAKRVRILC